MNSKIIVMLIAVGCVLAPVIIWHALMYPHRKRRRKGDRRG